MKHFVDHTGKLFAYEEDGSQDHLIGNKRAISDDEHKALVIKENERAFAAQSYDRKRLANYPSFATFLDAWVKCDETALEDYRQKCLAVKAQFPKEG